MSSNHNDLKPPPMGGGGSGGAAATPPMGGGSGGAAATPPMGGGSGGAAATSATTGANNSDTSTTSGTLKSPANVSGTKRKSQSTEGEKHGDASTAAGTPKKPKPSFHQARQSLSDIAGSRLVEVYNSVDSLKNAFKNTEEDARATKELVVGLKVQVEELKNAEEERAQRASTEAAEGVNTIQTACTNLQTVLQRISAATAGLVPILSDSSKTSIAAKMDGVMAAMQNVDKFLKRIDQVENWVSLMETVMSHNNRFGAALNELDRSKGKLDAMTENLTKGAAASQTMVTMLTDPGKNGLDPLQTLRASVECAKEIVSEFQKVANIYGGGGEVADGDDGESPSECDHNKAGTAVDDAEDTIGGDETAAAVDDSGKGLAGVAEDTTGGEKTAAIAGNEKDKAGAAPISATISEDETGNETTGGGNDPGKNRAATEKVGVDEKGGGTDGSAQMDLTGNETTGGGNDPDKNRAATEKVGVDEKGGGTDGSAQMDLTG